MLTVLMQGTPAAREALSVAAGEIRDPDEFYSTPHQVIYAQIVELFQAGRHVDTVTVADALRESGALDRVGGIAYLAGLIDEVGLAAHTRQYAEIIIAKATLRRLMDVGHVLYGKAAENREAPDDLLNAMSQRLYDLAQRRSGAKPERIGPGLSREYQAIEETASRGALLTGLPTGYRWLDQLTSGLQAGEMVVLAARPGMGKTSLALNIAEVVAAQKQVPVIFFSIEMSASSILRRLLCAHTKVNAHDVRSGRLYAEDKVRLQNGVAALRDLPVWVDESSRLTPVQVRARARQVFGEAGTPGLIVIDYLQLMDAFGEDGGRWSEGRQQEITAISRGIKAVAKDLRVPVLVLSQLNRASEARQVGARAATGGARPRLSDLRESGAIEQDADVVLFIYRDAADNAEQAGGDGDRQGYVARLVVAKQRNGPTGSFRLYFHRAATSFVELAESGKGGGAEDVLLPEDE